MRDAAADGLRVAAGDAIALVDGRLAARADDLDGALLAGLAAALAGADGAAELVSVYLGADAPAGAAERVPALIGEAHPELAVEVVAGGQPHYPYVAGLE